MQRSFIKGLYLIVFVLAALLSKAQVTVQINSGNPNFPFPQFLSYDFENTHSLGNLATTNAPGLVHAEMEKIMREAWQIEANRYEYEAGQIADVTYIRTNIGCPYDCSEGAGYALIAAAYMGDKKTFDGIWMREHDIRRVLQPSYLTGAIIRPGYQYGKNALAEPGGDAATDGDVDIALGLLMAWKQWGDNSGYTAANGTPISYKKEALDVIRGLVERENRGFMSGSVADCRSISGNVGFDGYLKNGNTWGEITTFGSGDPLWCPEFAGPQQLHIDYAAPAYFYSFRNVMTAEAVDPWEINQMHRVEASSDWIMGKLLDNPAGVPHAGWATVNGSNVTFSTFNEGEDFRAAWRTILNYVWHGDPDYTWDPVTHTVQSGIPNSFEQLIGKRFSGFLKDQRKAPWGNPCKDLGGGPDLTYTGPPVTSILYDPNTGEELFPLPINWGMATSAPSTIAAQDYDVMGDMFRQCAIEWDIDDAGDRYLTSRPKYFHGFFRLLGMLILSGNFQDPLVVKPIANVKLYRAVDKTYGATGDEFQFTLSYRNYGTVTASGVKIIETLPDDFDYIPGSATSGGTYDAGTHSITWNVGSVTGFSTAGGITPTQGVRSYKLKANTDADGRYCATATITATNSKSWTTNEYPNNVTEVMERNCIDIVKRALLIEKSVNYSNVQDSTEVKFKIDFENSSTAGWINGGRPNVFFSYAQGTYAANGDTRGIKIRLFHGAAEPYINYKNYRISAFLNDNTYTCVSGVGPCAAGWALRNTIYEGGAATGVTFSQESITPGQDARGKWNQRVIIQFADQIATTTPQLSAMYGMGARIHQGGTEPLRAVWDLYTSNYGSIDWSDDWSWDAAAQAPDGDKFFPVTNDWTDPYNLNIPVTTWHKNACEVAAKTVDNVLIEEWDGYTWRRAFGNGPLPGRDVQNVVVRDTLPLGLTFNGWVQQTALGINAAYDPATRIITWTIPKLQVGQKGSLEYKAIATFTTPGVCPKADQTHINAAWIEGLSESKKGDTANVTVTCDAVILPPVPTTMTKTADKAAYVVGDAINYTIEYEQTHGAIIDASMSTAADWNQYNGTWTFGSTIANTTTNTAGTMLIHKRAHGTNGTVTGSLQMAANAEFSVVLRQTGSTIPTGSYISFKSNPGAGTTNVRVWNGTTLLQTANLGYPGAPQNFKIELNDGQLNLWLGNVTGSPSMTVTGLTVQAGYIGFLNGTPTAQDSYASHTVVSLHSEMDSAYDIVLSDPVPSDITYTTASNGGTTTAGTISWPRIAGPVLYGTVITRTWTGTVATCSPTGKIVNNAYANMLGQAINSIAAQSVVTCSGTAVSCTPPTTVTVTTTKTALCKGAALTVKGTATPANANYFYTWYRNGVAVTAASKTYADYTKAVTVATDSGTYALRVEDGSAGTLACFRQNSIHIRIDTAASAGVVSANQEICLGSAAAALTGTVSTGGLAVKNYKWQRSAVSGIGPWTDVAPFSPAATGLIIGSPTATTYYRRIDSSGVCVNAVTNVDTIRVNNTPILNRINPILRDTLCIGENFNLSTSINLADSTGVNASKNGGYYFTWQHYQAGVLKTTIGPLPYKNFLAVTRAAVESDSGMYYLIVRDGKLAKKCMDTISLRIVINQGPAKKAIIEKHQEICKGDAASVLTEIAPAANYTGTILSQQWYTASDTTAASVVSKINGASGITYDPLSPVITQYYVRKDSVKFCPAVATNYIKIRVNNSVIADTIMPIENDTLCESLGSIFQLKGIVDSLGKSSINKGYYFTWMKVQEPSTTPVVIGTPGVYADYPPASREAIEDDSGTYYLIIQDGVGATACMDTLKTKVVVYKNCVIIPPACKKPVSVSAQLAGGNDTLCIGSTLHLSKDVIDTLPAPQEGYYFSWRRINAQGSTVLYGPSLTYADLTIPSTAAADSGKYYLIVQDGLTAPAACTTTSPAIAIAVHTPIVTPAVIAASDTICSGATPGLFTETMPATGGNGTPYRYQWYISTDSFKTVAGASVLAGSTLKTYQAPALTATSYYVRVDSAGVCPKAVTNILTIQVDVPAVAGTVGRDTVVCTGSPVFEFTENTPASGGTGIYTYQWQQSSDNNIFTDITGATGTSYQSPAVLNRTYFKRIDSSGVCAAARTNTIFVDVVNGADPGKITGPVTAICYNTVPATTFSNVEAASNGSGGPGSESYQWQISTDNIYWVDITGETGLTYTETNPLTDTTYYRRRVGMGPGTCDTAYTSPIDVNVYDPLIPGVISTDTTICSGIAVSVLETAPASGGGEPNSLIYQWIQSIDTGMNWTDADNINNQSTYTTPVLTDSVWYARIVTSVCKIDTTNIRRVYVDSINTVSITMSDMSTCIGLDVTFAPTFTGEGTSPVYEWYKASASSGPWSQIAGAAGASYTIANTQLSDNGYYKATVASSFICNSGIAESIVQLSVQDAIEPKVTISSSPAGQVCDTIKRVTYTATPVQGTGTVTTYQWYDGLTNTPIPSETDQTFTPAADPVAGQQVYVVMTTDLVCASPSTARSATLELDIIAKPQPVIMNSDTTICTPYEVRLKAKDTSGGMLQWYKNGVAITDANTAMYIVPASDYPGAEYVLVEDNGVCRSSDTVTVEMWESPAANAGTDIYAVEGETVSLNGSVSSNTTNYVWIPASPLNDAYILQPSLVVPDVTTVYTLVAYNHGNVCSGSDAVIIIVEKQIKIPNVITVNGDGVNDTWDIENIQNFPDAEILIYNRWGNLVWKSAGYPKQWDATNYRNGEVLPDGTYFYIIDLHTEKVKETFTGYIQVVK